MKNNLIIECDHISVFQKAAHLNNRPFILWSKHICHVLGSVAPGAPIQFSVHICHIFIQSYKLRHQIGQELRCWKRGQNRQEEESILCYRGHITPSITLHPHANCVDVLQIKVLSIILVYTNLSISQMWLFC